MLIMIYDFQTPIVRVRFPARRYSFDGDGNLVIRQHKQRYIYTTYHDLCTPQLN